MRLKYDLDVGALYIALADRPVARTRDLDDNTSVDLDEAGEIVGIEVISISHPWALIGILRDYQIPDAEADQLRTYFMSTAAAPVASAPALSIERNAAVRVPA
ncbi:MAG TPA: DUF2283 domain-containing protein [Streptosporangiaceae bacterium]|jgi:uncharacterized protein YuzE